MSKNDRKIYTTDHSIQFLCQGTVVCRFTSHEMEIDQLTELSCVMYDSGEDIKNALAGASDQIRLELGEHLAISREERCHSFTCPDQVKAIVSVFKQTIGDLSPIKTDVSIEFEVTHEFV